MISLTKYINEELKNTLSSNQVLNEGRIKNMSDTEWLTHKYCTSGTYIQILFDPVQTHALYGISRNQVDHFKDIMKKDPSISRFRTVKANSPYYAILCFKYDPKKDIDRQEAINGEAEQERLAAERFEAEVQAVDTSKYVVDQKHVKKMVDYFNKHSDPERLVNSIKDDNKLIGRWIAAIVIDWPDAVGCFSREIARRKLLSKAELVAISQKFENEKLANTGKKSMTALEEKLSSSWITSSVFKFFDSLEGYTVEWIEAFKNAKTSEGQRAMSRNGRAWTEGFIVEITNDDNGKSRKITFDVVTNEGGGLYGYVIDGVFSHQIITLKEFKQKTLSIIKDMLS